MSTDTGIKLRVLRAAQRMQCGILLAHPTSTVPGVAASPVSRRAVSKLQRFKQRSGPFLLLADSLQTAMHWARYMPAALRLSMHKHWPGHTTFVFPGRPGLPAACYAQGNVAIRVDADAACRTLADACGGMIISSSLNRKEQALQTPGHRLRMRWHRHIGQTIREGVSTCDASRLLCWRAGKLHQLR